MIHIKHDDFYAYGTVSRALHWSMALGFFLMMATVIAFKIDEEYYSLMIYHKVLGVLLLVLGTFRLLWAMWNRKNRPHSPILVKIAHAILYVVMLFVPALGALRQYGSAKSPLEFAGITLIPAAPEKIQLFISLGNQWHEVMGYVLFVLMIGHIMMAVVHQMKGEKIINRMAK